MQKKLRRAGEYSKAQTRLSMSPAMPGLDRVAGIMPKLHLAVSLNPLGAASLNGIHSEIVQVTKGDDNQPLKGQAHVK